MPVLLSGVEQEQLPLHSVFGVVRVPQKMQSTSAGRHSRASDAAPDQVQLVADRHPETCAGGGNCRDNGRNGMFILHLIPIEGLTPHYTDLVAKNYGNYCGECGSNILANECRKSGDLFAFV